jgi:hypothetical protein
MERDNNRLGVIAQSRAPASALWSPRNGRRATITRPNRDPFGRHSLSVAILGEKQRLVARGYPPGPDNALAYAPADRLDALQGDIA